MRADAVADRLAAGDACAAAAEADDLLHETVRAVRAGEVPEALQQQLVGGAQELLQRIECRLPEPEPPAEEPPPAPPPPTDDDLGDDAGEDDDEDDEEEGRGQGQGKGKGKGKGKGGGRG